MSDVMSNLDDRIIKPKTTDALDERALALSTKQLLSFVDRAELAGIMTLMIKGSITRGDVWGTLLHFYGINKDNDNTPPVSAHTDLKEVWMRLDGLASNCLPALPVEQDSYLRPMPRAAGDTMYLIEREMRSGRLHESELAKLLPGELVSYVFHRKVIESYGTPMAIGYSLEAQPALGGGLGFGGKGQSIWVADAFAQALLYSVNVYDEIIDPASDESKVELGRIRLWWMLLKGFTYSLAHRYSGLQTLPELADHPEMFERIKQALTIGLERLRTADIETTPKWSGMRSRTSSKVQKMSTSALIELLEQRVAAAAKETENLHR